MHTHLQMKTGRCIQFMLAIFWTYSDTHFEGETSKICQRQIFHLRCARAIFWTDEMTLQSGQPHLILHKNILFKNRNTYLFAVLFRASKVVRHCTSTRQHQTPCSTPLHAVPHQQQCPTSHLAFDVPRLKPKLTHLERVGETYSRHSEWTPLLFIYTFSFHTHVIHTFSFYSRVYAKQWPNTRLRSPHLFILWTCLCVPMDSRQDTRQTKADGWLQHFLNADKQLFVTGSCSSCLQLVMLVEVLVIILWLLPVFFCPGWQLGTVAPGWTLQQFHPTLNISGKYGGTFGPLTLTHVVPHNSSILYYNIFYA